MEIETSRFGAVQIEEEDIYTFEDGILGFPGIENYVLLDHPGGGPFRWLQSVEKPNLAFVVCDPLRFFPDYEVEVPEIRAKELGLNSPDEGFVLVIMTIRSRKEDITANLKGPLIFNPEGRKALQFVLSSGTYTTKHYVFSGSDHDAGDPAEE